MTANERDSRVAVVHGYFPEGGDSILSAFSWELFSGGSRISQRRVLLKKARIARAKISEPRPFARWPRLL